ncbi:MAG: dihydrolipoyl dehydrogenase [Dehalococcoidia bacterium]|jgi:dihydrolipoamide dehydrogenase
MKKYDIMVIGSGCGAIIADEATEHGLKTAMIDKGPLVGGTCLNWGCIPSKMLISVADRIVDIQQAGKMGVTADIREIDFPAIMNRMRRSRRESQQHIREGIDGKDNLDFYEGEGHFTGDYALEVKGEEITAEKIVIASGSRTFIPPVEGLDTVDYLTNESVLELKEKPSSLIIIGGGYIAVEFGHFFAAMGTKVAILEMADRLVLSEEPEIAELLEKKLKERMAVYTGARVESVEESRDGVKVTALDAGGKKAVYTTEQIMLAVGRRFNADTLRVEKTGVDMDERGFIRVNERMETNRKNIFAVGDANGRQMFTHMANREAAIVAANLLHDTDMAVDYAAVPHAVYSHPQIASVGLREEEARKEHDVLTGTTKYYEIAKGEAIMETEGFVKVIIEKETENILGVHIIGPSAPELIQEAVNAMTSGGDVDELNEGIHIHPALSELIPTAVNSVAG